VVVEAFERLLVLLAVAADAESAANDNRPCGEDVELVQRLGV
jgi:hypothetical protein